MMTPDQLADQLTARLDGPHGDEHTTGAAHLAAEAVRFLNYATGSHCGAGLRYPATVYEVTADLSSAAGRLPQLCRQLSGWLHDQAQAGRLGTDDGTDPAITVGIAAGLLDEAAGLAGRLGGQFAALQSAISGLNARGGAQ